MLTGRAVKIETFDETRAGNDPALRLRLLELALRRLVLVKKRQPLLHVEPLDVANGEVSEAPQRFVASFSGNGRAGAP